ncbi:MAG: hypothetical protein H7Y11_13320 [Armatimonadetes bacterium]|nr:hypothetical protein [Anaerolineae bacterium]
MNFKRISIILAVVVVALVSVSAVGAQRGGGDGQGGGRGGEQRGGRGDRPFGAGGARGEAGLIQIIADETGLTVREITDQVRAGSTLAEVIIANGSTVEVVTAAAVEAGTERINQAVANERITQARADELLANLETNITTILNRDYENARYVRAVVERVSGETGLGNREIMQQWRDGATLSDILVANGEDVQAFSDETLARADARLDIAVTSGRLTQEAADSRSAAFATALPEILNQAFPADLMPEADMMPEPASL